MHSLPHHRAFCYADFLTLPLGEWSKRTGLEPLTPGGRHVQGRTGLSAAMANIYADIHGVGQVSSK
jgi:hypothetical protein